MRGGGDGEEVGRVEGGGGSGAEDADRGGGEGMARMGTGCGRRLADENGEEGSVKVAWISTLTSRLLLVNRRGLRKLVASPHQLAALFKAGPLSSSL